MTELTCGVGKCAFNKDNMCMNNSICVGGRFASNVGNTYCSSFQQANFLVNLNEYGKSTVDIECEAENCIHNEQGECTAKNIVISSENVSEHNDTMCDSFVLKK